MKILEKVGGELWASEWRAEPHPEEAVGGGQSTVSLTSELAGQRPSTTQLPAANRLQRSSTSPLNTDSPAPARPAAGPTGHPLLRAHSASLRNSARPPATAADTARDVYTITERKARLETSSFVVAISPAALVVRPPVCIGVTSGLVGGRFSCRRRRRRSGIIGIVRARTAALQDGVGRSTLTEGRALCVFFLPTSTRAHLVSSARTLVFDVAIRRSALSTAVTHVVAGAWNCNTQVGDDTPVQPPVFTVLAVHLYTATHHTSLILLFLAVNLTVFFHDL